MILYNKLCQLYVYLQLRNNTQKWNDIPVSNYNAYSLITTSKTFINGSKFSITISKITGKQEFVFKEMFTIYTDNDYSIGNKLGLDFKKYLWLYIY